MNSSIPSCPKFNINTARLYNVEMGLINLQIIIYLVAVPLQSILGILGNLLSFLVTRKLPDPISSLYLRYLALFNAFACFFDLFYPFLEKLGHSILTTFQFTCQWNMFVRKFLILTSKTFKRSSIMIMTFFFLDRYIVVTHPDKTNHWRNSAFHSYIPLSSLTFAMVFSLPILKWYRITKCANVLYYSTGHDAAASMSTLSSRFRDSYFADNDILHKTGIFCDRHIVSNRSFWYIFYEVIRELIWIYIPTGAMCYFMLMIGISIMKFKMRNIKRSKGTLGFKFKPTTIKTYISDNIIINVSKTSLKSNQITPMNIEISQNRSTNNSRSHLLGQQNFISSKIEMMPTLRDENNDVLKSEEAKSPTQSVFIAKFNLLKPRINYRNSKSSHNSSPEEEILQNDFKKYKSNKKVVIILCGFVLMYCSSIIPASVISLVYTFSTKEGNLGFKARLNDADLIAISVFLDQANYCWCFYLYTFLDSVFRAHLLRVIRCQRNISPVI